MNLLGGDYFDEAMKYAFHNIEFHFLGFKGRGAELQSHGWEFTASKHHQADCYEPLIAFFLSHDSLGLRGYSDFHDTRSIFNAHGSQSLMGINTNQPVMIQEIVSKDYNRGMRYIPKTGALLANLEHTPIDFSETVGRSTSIQEIMEGIPFAKVNLDNNFEIYLNEKDEKEIMQIVLDKQDNKQKEIRENMRRRDRFSGEVKPAEARAILKVV